MGLVLFGDRYLGVLNIKLSPLSSLFHIPGLLLNCEMILPVESSIVSFDTLKHPPTLNP
jgi:hypothetical protein